MCKIVCCCTVLEKQSREKLGTILWQRTFFFVFVQGGWTKRDIFANHVIYIYKCIFYQKQQVERSIQWFTPGKNPQLRHPKSSHHTIVRWSGVWESVFAAKVFVRIRGVRIRQVRDQTWNTIEYYLQGKVKAKFQSLLSYVYFHPSLLEYCSLRLSRSNFSVSQPCSKQQEPRNTLSLRPRMADPTCVLDSPLKFLNFPITTAQNDFFFQRWAHIQENLLPHLSSSSYPILVSCASINQRDVLAALATFATLLNWLMLLLYVGHVRAILLPPSINDKMPPVSYVKTPQY